MRILHLLSFLLLPLPSLHVKPRAMTVAIRIPSTQYGPRLPDVRCWIPVPREEDSAGGGMKLALLVCATTDFPVEDARAFGQLCMWGGLECPRRPSLCCALAIDASALFAALFPFLDCPASATSAAMSPLAVRVALSSAWRACASPSRVHFAIYALLLEVGGMSEYGLRIGGEGREATTARDGGLPFPASRIRASSTGGYARTHLRGWLVCGGCGECGSSSEAGAVGSRLEAGSIHRVSQRGTSRVVSMRNVWSGVGTGRECAISRLAEMNAAGSAEKRCERVCLCPRMSGRRGNGSGALSGVGLGYG
ncbi:hypothetical protein B0H13DRAFT_2275231 [Mycena leptocephala]|nr:hypothetical protein B0H13DRAFT_2275231 [Mycena leptocephala]